MDSSTKTTARATPWNKGKLLGQKPPLKLREIWALPVSGRSRQRAEVAVAVDSWFWTVLDLLKIDFAR
jgi:hypothetical protein